MRKRGLIAFGALLLIVGLWAAGPGAPGAADLRRMAVPLVMDAPATPSVRAMTVGAIVGQVEALAPSTPAWAQVAPGQALPQGSVIRTVGESRVRLDITDGSFVALGFSTTMTLTQLSPETLNPVTLLDMGCGWLVFRTPSERGSGSFQVRTNDGSVFAGSVASPALRPPDGAGLVSADSAGVKQETSASHSEIPLYEGLGTVFGEHTDLLQAAAGSRVLVGGLLYGQPVIGGPLTLEDLAEQQALMCLGASGFLDITACDWTPTPTPTATRTPTNTPPAATATATNAPTNTPSPTPFVRPTRSWPTPDPSEPLSAEELANQGAHSYTYTAVGHGECHPDPSGAETVTFAFSSMAVTLSAPGSEETITYTKISHNVYRLVAGTTTAYIQFTANGWLYWADVGGYACVDYTYRLADGASQ